MNPTHAITAPQPLLSAPARIGGLAAALAVIAASVSFASQASEKAVRTAQAAIAPHAVHVMLPAVEVIYKRSAAEVADVSCAAPQSRT
jgi:hypothetical protein